MNLKTVVTPEGVVVRVLHASGEHAYRLTNDGQWQKTADHKSLWINIQPAQVPDEILKEVIL